MLKKAGRKELISIGCNWNHLFFVICYLKRKKLTWNDALSEAQPGPTKIS